MNNTFKATEANFQHQVENLLFIFALELANLNL